MTRTWKLVLIASLVGNLTIIYVGYKALGYRSHINHFLDLYTKVVSEFSGRQYYEVENQGLADPVEGRPRIVFLGTQVTERWNVAEDFPDYEAINRGVDGQRFAGFLLRFRADVINLRPDAVMIEISSYNFRPELSVQELKEYTLSLVDLALANNITPLVGTVIPPVAGTTEPENYKLDDSLYHFNQWLMDYGVQSEMMVVDFASVLCDEDGHLRNDLAADAIDPNAAGYRLMTEAVTAVLNERAAAGKRSE